MIRNNRATAALAVSALAFGGVVAAAPQATAAPGECIAPTTTVNVYSFNDFHGRINNAAALFTPVEADRAANGEDRVLLTSAGDNIGGSTFVSVAGNDGPTTDVLNAAGVEAIAVGNHEFDKGWAALSARITGGDFDMPISGANVYDAGTTTVASPLVEYSLFTKGGVTIAFIGAVTSELPSLVSPAGIADLSVGDPVAQVNRVAAQLVDGDESNGEAEIIIASIHEGAGDGSSDAASQAAASADFDNIYSHISDDIDVVFNGHTHQIYTWQTASGAELVQAGQYGSNLARVELSIDATNRGLCQATSEILDPAETPDASLARISAIQSTVAAAEVEAELIGQDVIGSTTEAISTPADGSSGTRNQESPMSNAVAQMFYDQLSDGDTEFIGIQNPGGNRSSINAGDVTYQEAALVLPFANSLFTTQITGAQFKTVLEQQWQRDSAGAVPSRPFLQLGLSKNVSYTYDESLPEGQRITSISINSAPIDPAATYTVGSGSFLISGGDNFRELANGTNTTDTGRIDLEAWVEWVRQNSPLSPDYSKRGVSVTESGTELVEGGDGITFTLGDILADGVAPQTLDMLLDATGEAVSPQLFNSVITAYIGNVEVGTAPVSEGVGTIRLRLPEGTKVPAGDQIIRFAVEASGTQIFWPVTVVLHDDAPSTVSPSPTRPPRRRRTPLPRGCRRPAPDRAG
ncbi:MAG: bifunctional metallophosphatase/5'-nucleotidase [Arachnia sp.]